MIRLGADESLTLRNANVAARYAKNGGDLIGYVTLNKRSDTTYKKATNK